MGWSNSKCTKLGIKLYFLHDDLCRLSSVFDQMCMTLEKHRHCITTLSQPFLVNVTNWSFSSCLVNLDLDISYGVDRKSRSSQVWAGSISIRVKYAVRFCNQMLLISIKAFEFRVLSFVCNPGLRFKYGSVLQGL